MQTKSKFTPGPWKVNETWGTIEAMGDREICAVHAADGGGVVSRFNKESCKANASLIAAAPDMHAACAELIYGDGSSESLQRTIDLARKALGI